MPSEQPTIEITGSPACFTVSRISRRSWTPVSSGSAEMSIESKPIFFVRRIPSAVPNFDPNHAELISPSFMRILLQNLPQQHGSMFVQRPVAGLHQRHGLQVIA